VPILQTDAFRECRDIFLERATIDASSSVSPAIARGNPPASMQDLYHIEDLRRRIDPASKIYVHPLADPTAWYSASEKFLNLFRVNPDKLKELSYRADQNDFPQLDQIIANGEYLETFTRTVLLDENRKLKRDRLKASIDKITALRGTLLLKIGDQLSNKSTEIDATRGLSQPFSKVFPFELFAHPLGKCESTKLDFTSFDTYHYIFQYPKGGEKNSYNGRVNDAVYGPALNLFKNDLQNINFKLLSLDSSFVKALPGYLPLVEQFNVKKYTLAPCLSEMTFSNLSQSSAGTEADITIKIDVNVHIATPEGGFRTLKALTMGGTIHTKTPDAVSSNWYQALGNTSPIIFSRNVPEIWQKGVLGKFDSFLMPLEDAHSNEAAKVFSDELTEQIRLLQDRIKTLVSTSVIDQEKELVQTRNDLRALSKIGLNNGDVVVQGWLRVLEDDTVFKTPSKVLDEVIGGGSDLGGARKDMERSSISLLAALDDLAALNNLSPPPDAFDDRLNELRRLRLIRRMAERADKQ
jgi:hypothetical protein